MLSIGAFSKISRVSPNALRYYDEIDLIKPAHVNHENGYRYYDVSQLRTILLINKLKSYNLSLEEISTILKNPEDDQLLIAYIKQKRESLGKMLHHLTYTSKHMDQDLLNLERGIHIMSNLDKIEVKLVEKEPVNILYIRKKMSTTDCARYFAQLGEQVKNENLTMTGAPINIFHHEEEFNPECYDNEVAYPIKEQIPGTRLLPGGTCAMATLHGPYTELASVYAKLQQWIEKENYTLASAPYEAYITDPGVTPPEENITEVYLPIKK